MSPAHASQATLNGLLKSQSCELQRHMTLVRLERHDTIDTEWRLFSLEKFQDDMAAFFKYSRRGMFVYFSILCPDVKSLTNEN